VHAQLRHDVFAANVKLVEAGLVTLTFGNVSGIDRAEGVMAIKPSGVPYEDLDPETIVLVDLASGDVIDGELRPSSDTPTHLVLYRRFASIGGIAHTHSPFATAWAQAAREIPCFGTTHADHFYGSVPVTRPLTAAEIGAAYEAATGDAIVETVEHRGSDPLDVCAVLVHSHGPFTWGRDPEQAVENSIALEAIARLAGQTLALRPDTPAIGEALLNRHFRRKHGADAYYGQR
jgi:L-ribulose-5-phosphate 4-epimerase